MARPLTQGVRRPSCPQGHRGRVWLYGRYARTGVHERARWQCVPGGGGKRHTFTRPLPSRHPTLDHPAGGSSCEFCEHHLTPDEGPRTPHGFTFTMREVARALISVGREKSMRQTARAARVDAERRVPTWWGGMEASKAGNLVMGWVDEFAEVVLTPDEPPAWPAVVALDAVPFRSREWREDRWISGGRSRGAVLGAVGYQRARDGRLWNVTAAGGNDAASWEDFLRSLPGEPEWVVADADQAIRRAVTTVWPNAYLYICEWHIKERMKLTVFGGAAPPPDGSPIDTLINRSTRSLADWQALLDFVDNAKDMRLRKLSNWLDFHAVAIEAQLQQRRSDRPVSTGRLESDLTTLKDRIGDRCYVFRNLDRLNKVLRLIRADIALKPNERVYYRRLLDRLAPADGRTGADWSAHRDPKGTSSLFDAIATAKTRKATRRAAALGAANTRRAQKQRMKVVAARIAAGQPASAHKRRSTPLVYTSTAGKFASDYARLMAEWHVTKNAGLDPFTLRAGRHVKVWWQCLDEPSHEWQAEVISRAGRGTGCPYCMNRKVHPTNCLATVHPSVAAQWHPTKNGKLSPNGVMPGNTTRVVWLCPRGHEWRESIMERTNRDRGCAICSHAERRAKARTRRRPTEPDENVDQSA